MPLHQIIVSLLHLKRPFKKLKDLDIEELATKVTKK